ncbi:MAG: C4-dicarboxylate ABC transporter, partial [Acetobacteraceae bacterium]
VGGRLCITPPTAVRPPPVGFALVNLRGIAPPSVATRDIYLGAIPWLGLQLVLVAIVILWPELITAFVHRPLLVDPASVIIDAPPPPDPSTAPPIVFN